MLPFSMYVTGSYASRREREQIVDFARLDWRFAWPFPWGFTKKFHIQT